MIDTASMQELETNMQRIFALKVGKTTFREVQNALFAAAKGDRDDASALFEALLRGELRCDHLEKEAQDILARLVGLFCIPLRVARDIQERGDFIQVITSDRAAQSKEPVFINSIRRIDGEQLQFLSDVGGIFHILQHFIGRLHELCAAQKEESGDALKAFAKEIDYLSDGLQKLKN